MRGQLLRFAAVGCVGFAVDVAVLQLLLTAGAGLLWGRAGSFLTAASTTWALNRRYTFSDRAATAGPIATGHQWLRFLAANGLGGAINFGVYSALVLGSGLCREQPALAVAAGSVGGLAVNYSASRHWVFRSAS
jgi:putative flippase GtrA